MTAAAPHDSPRARAVDRLCELASVGAGHAAGALATLFARPFVMGVPEPRASQVGPAGFSLATSLGAEPREWCGVLFNVSGGPGGALALFLTPSARAALLCALLGKNAGGAEQAESALCELGNIVASHALSAIGELAGALVLPSPPQYVAVDAPRAFARLLAERASGQPALHIEVELCDRANELRALLVWAPAEIA
jgi:chemotaxis protein CheY-P-specific phosphatase CheC